MKVTKEKMRDFARTIRSARSTGTGFIAAAAVLVFASGGVRADRVTVVGATVQWSGEIVTNGTIRACAGGIDDHTASDSQYRAHTREVTAQVTDGQGNPQVGLQVYFWFNGNQGHNYGNGAAPLLATMMNANGGSAWTTTLSATTDGNGAVQLWIKSSDVICKPQLCVSWPDANGPQIGQIGCDFAGAETLRHFPNADEPGQDTGWLFLVHYFAGPGSIAPCKVYLKFQKDPDAPDSGAKPNWNFVNGHLLLLHADSATLLDGSTATGLPNVLAHYGYVVSLATGQQSPNEVAAERTTTGEGETQPQAYVVAGPDITSTQYVTLKSEDLTQWNN